MTILFSCLNSALFRNRANAFQKPYLKIMNCIILNFLLSYRLSNSFHPHHLLNSLIIFPILILNIFFNIPFIISSSKVIIFFILSFFSNSENSKKSYSKYSNILELILFSSV